MAAKRTKSETTEVSLAEIERLPLLTPKLPPVKERRTNSAVNLYERVRKGESERRAFRERRATRRVTVGLNLEAKSETHTLIERTHDLSTFGLSIRGGKTLKKGTALALRLFLPDDPSDPLILSGVVVGSFDAKGGMRVKFKNPPIDAVRRIHRLVK